jgi:hypothetical protein
MAVTYQVKTFADIYTAVIEELKIQATDTTTINRVKRDINILYLEEVVPFANWKWLRGNVELQVQAVVTAGTANCLQNSAQVTLTVPPAGSKKGFWFSVVGQNDIYKISQHTANSTVLYLETPFNQTTGTTYNYQIWSDEVPLPTFARETFEVTHDYCDQPLENCGLQKFRQYVSALPKAQGRPIFYTTDGYYDPGAYQTIPGLPALSTRSSAGLLKTLVFSSDVSSYFTPGAMFEITLAGDNTYNGKYEISSVNTTTITYTGVYYLTESAVADAAMTFQLYNAPVDSRRQKRILCYPAINTYTTTLHVDYLKEVIALTNDTDEPLIPVSDRVILLYGALQRAWGRERNPEEAKKNEGYYEKKLQRMAGKIDDSIDNPVLRVNRVYLDSKRMAQRGRWSGFPDGWGGGGGSGATSVPTGTANTVAYFNTSGLLTSSITTGTELAYVHGVTSSIQTQLNTCLTLAGGLFSLTADVNFGPTFGVIAPYFKSTSANLAQAGVIRLANADLIEWRNAANSGNDTLGVNASDQLTYNSFPLVSGGGGYTTTATAAGTTTLTVASTTQQYFTGSTTQTVLLPVASTLTLGFQFQIINQSSGVVTVQSSGANTIQAMAQNFELVVTCILTSGTGTASWNWSYLPTKGTALPVPNGGTGATSLTTNAILVGNGTGAVAPAANTILVNQNAGDHGDISLNGAYIGLVSSAPSWGIATNDFYLQAISTKNISFGNATNGILGSWKGTGGLVIGSANDPLLTASGGNLQISTAITSGAWQGTPVTVPFGGTGASTFLAHSILIGNGTSAFNTINLGNSGQVMTSTGASSDPTMQNPSTWAYFSGTMPNATSWSTTSASFADPTNSGNNTLTAIYSANLTVTAAASNLPGVTWTPSSSTAVYLVTASFDAIDTTTLAVIGYRLTDGSTAFAWATIGEGTATPSQGVHAVVLQGIYAPGTASAVTVKVQIAVSTGTGYINGYGSFSAPSIVFNIVQLHP